MSQLPMKSCDYLVVGAGATGMAFVDSLLQGLLSSTSGSTTGSRRLKIVLMDQHAQPGGQWNDSYAFVQLHQPSAMYGVESTPLEPPDSSSNSGDAHRATRPEILDYYAKLVKQWESSDTVDFEFVGRATVDLESGNKVDGGQTYSYSSTTTTTAESMVIRVKRRLVDARYLEPDLPVSTAPKFDYEKDSTKVVPVNDIYRPEKDGDASHNSFVVIGAGKTGMDAIYYLRTQRKIAASQIVWVVPHDPWITAREKIGNCMEFVRDAALLESSHALDSTERVQETFAKWEQEGKIYRLFSEDGKEWPTKFNDATLSKDELAVLRSIPAANLVRGRGRVQRIDSQTGALVLQDGSSVALPWTTAPGHKTTYVHCSAGAFNYTHQRGLPPTPVFDQHKIILQDVYGTPGFCFVGSILGKLESLCYLEKLEDEQANRLCQVPSPPPVAGALGPSGGDVGGLSKDHGWVQRLGNLKRWLATPELRDWLVGHRLFNLGHYPSAEELDALVEETWTVLKKGGLVG